MLASGFTSAPVSQCFFFGVIASSILVSITDTKYLFYIQVVPHLWQYRQLWRLLTWQVCPPDICQSGDCHPFDPELQTID